MEAAEEHEHSEQAAGEHGGLRAKKRRFAIAVVVSVALLSLLVIVWMRRDPDVNSVLSAAGFARRVLSSCEELIAIPLKLLSLFHIFTEQRPTIPTVMANGRPIHYGGIRAGAVEFGARSLLRRSSRSTMRSFYFPHALFIGDAAYNNDRNVIAGTVFERGLDEFRYAALGVT